MHFGPPTLSDGPVSRPRPFTEPGGSNHDEHRTGEAKDTGVAQMAELRVIAVSAIERHPLNTRSELRKVEELAASIEAAGALVEPIVVFKTADERYRPIAGHRRAAAVELLGWETVEVVVREVGDSADQLRQIIVANTQRDDLSAVEEARAEQQLFDFGLRPTEVAKITGRKVAEVKLAPVVATASAEVEETVRATQATLEEAAALVEFEGDEDATRDLGRSIVTGNFAHVLAQKRQSREWDQKCEEARAWLEEAGARIHGEDHAPYVGSWVSIERLKLKPEEHAGCKGAIAVIKYDGEVEFYCTKPGEHGLRTSAAGKPVDPAEDKRKREAKAAWKAAGTVRRAHVARILGDTSASVMRAKLILAAAEAAGHGLQVPCAKLTRELAEVFIGGRTGAHAVLAGMAAVGIEKALDDWLTCWNGTLEHQSDSVKRVAHYYEFLAETGYKRAECEDALFDSVSDAELGRELPPSFTAEWGPIETGSQRAVVTFGEERAEVSIEQIEMPDESAGFEVRFNEQFIERFSGGAFDDARTRAEGLAAELLSTGQIDRGADLKSIAAGEGAPGSDDYEAACRVCGCTADQACPGGCFWIPDNEGDLCSQCAAALRRRYSGKDGRVLYASKGLGENYMTMRDGHRVSSPSLPVRSTLAEAQIDLDIYAYERGFETCENAPGSNAADICPACEGDGRVKDKTGGGHHGTCETCGGTGKAAAQSAQVATDEVDFTDPRIAAAWRTEIPATVKQLADGPSTFHWHGAELYKVAADQTKSVLRASVDTTRREPSAALADLRDLSAEYGGTVGDWHVVGYLPGPDGAQQYTIYEIHIGGDAS